MTFRKHTPYAQLKKRWKDRMVQLTIAVTVDQRLWLEKQANATETSLSEVLRALVAEAMRGQETDLPTPAEEPKR